jgi:hypothetical protein
MRSANTRISELVSESARANAGSGRFLVPGRVRCMVRRAHPLRMSVWKARVMAKLVPVLAACLLTPGCFGFVVNRTRTETFKQPWIADRPSISAVSTNYSTDVPTAVWLQEHWGKPASIRRVSTQGPAERWTYKFRVAWCGIVPCVIVPVPLVLPLAREKVVFFVREGQVVSAEAVKGHASGVFWQPIGPDAYPVGFARW